MRCLPPVHSPLTAAALRRGALASTRGERERRAVEARLLEIYSPCEVFLTDSGTSALRLALEAARNEGRTPVAMPAYNCFDLVSAARGAGIDVVYYDLDPDTLGPDPQSVARALAGGARSIVVASLYGMPIDLEGLGLRGDHTDVLLIEDAAQGVGGEYRDRPLGAFGDLSVLSFARGKGRTGGGGGALLACTDAGSRLVSELSVPAAANGRIGTVLRAAAQWLLTRPGLYGLPRALPFLHLGETRYREPRRPAALSSASAAMLDAAWGEAEREVAIRRARGADYRAALADVRGVKLAAAPPNSTPGDLRVPVRLADPPRGERERQAARLGLAAGYPRILPEIDPGPGDRTAGDLPGARELVERLWTLPAHRFVAEGDLRAIVELLRGGE